MGVFRKFRVELVTAGRRVAEVAAIGVEVAKKSVKQAFERPSEGPFKGALDIVLVEQEDGSVKSTLWHVRPDTESRFFREGLDVKLAINDEVLLKLDVLAKQDANGGATLLPHPRQLAQIVDKLRDDDIKHNIKILSQRSVRPIGQTYWNYLPVGSVRHGCTKDLQCFLILRWTSQFLLLHNDGKTLPDGAVITSTLGRHRTVTRHTQWIPHSAFKAPWLQQFRKIFPGTPFHAAFGNQDTDVESYHTVGIPDSNIFHILKNGKVVTYEDRE